MARSSEDAASGGPACQSDTVKALPYNVAHPSTVNFVQRSCPVRDYAAVPSLTVSRRRGHIFEVEVGVGSVHEQHSDGSQQAHQAGTEFVDGAGEQEGQDQEPNEEVEEGNPPGVAKELVTGNAARPASGSGERRLGGLRFPGVERH